MPYIRLHPYFDLFAGSSTKLYSDFPLQESELVKVQMRVAPPYSVEDQSEEYSKYNARFHATLTPIGQPVPDDDIVLGIVIPIIGASISYQLEFTADKDNVLAVLFTDEDQEVYNQFKEKVRSVLVPLEISLVEKKGDSWVVRLSPFGEEVNGLILSEVEIVK